MIGDEGETLPMFLPPEDIYDLVAAGDWGSVDQIHGGWDYKRDEQYDDLVASIQAGEQIRMPIVLQPPVVTYWGDWVPVMVGNGHHRVVAATDEHLPYVPIVWSESAFATTGGDGRSLYNQVDLGYSDDER